MFVDTIDANRLKGAVTDVQGNAEPAHASRFESLENAGSEVKARSRSGDGPADACIDGLVAIAIRSDVIALDIGRQRHVSQRIDGIPHWRTVVGPQPHRATAMKMTAKYFGVEAMGGRLEHHLRSLAQSLSGMHQRTPRVGSLGWMDEKAFGGPAPWQATSDQPRREDARIVDHYRVTGVQQ